MEDSKGRAIVEKFYKELETLTDEILKVNDERVTDGFLPYPYLLPDFVTNSVST